MSPHSCETNKNWRLIFPDADHRWVMGLRRGDEKDFFATRDQTGAILCERRCWLAEDPERYAALQPVAEPALRETVKLARALGVSINSNLTLWDQLLALGCSWESDFVWMHPDENGVHRLVGGVVCFPSSWALQEKLGQTMGETHRPVPGLNALDSRIEVFFEKMVPGMAWIRENANYSRVPDLNQHPQRPRPPLDHNTKPTDFWLRLEHQLLLKMQFSKSILFAIRIETVSMPEILRSPEAVSGLVRLLETMSDDAAKYKGVSEIRFPIAQYLRDASSREE